jgi:hypothetical protein
MRCWKKPKAPAARRRRKKTMMALILVARDEHLIQFVRYLLKTQKELYRLYYTIRAANWCYCCGGGQQINFDTYKKETNLKAIKSSAAII